MRVPLMNNFFSSMVLSSMLSFLQTGFAYLTFGLLSRYYLPVVLINGKFSSPFTACHRLKCVYPPKMQMLKC